MRGEKRLCGDGDGGQDLRGRVGMGNVVVGLWERGGDGKEQLSPCSSLAETSSNHLQANTAAHKLMTSFYSVPVRRRVYYRRVRLYVSSVRPPIGSIHSFRPFFPFVRPIRPSVPSVLRSSPPSSVPFVHPSVRPFFRTVRSFFRTVRPSVRPSVCPIRPPSARPVRPSFRPSVCPSSRPPYVFRPFIRRRLIDR